MQKIDKKASILLWSIFLSMVVSSSFIYISTKINQNIKLNSYITSFFVDDITSNGEKALGENEYVLEDTFSYAINNQDRLILTFTGSSIFTGVLTLNSGGPIFYETLSYSGSDDSLTSSSSFSGLVYTGAIFTGFLDSNYDVAKLTLQNLGGMVIITINSDTNLPLQRKYKIIKTIGGKNIEKAYIYDN